MLLTPARIKLFPKAPALRRIKKSLISFWVKSCSQIQFASSSKHNLVQTARRRNLISYRQRFPLRMTCPQQSPGHLHLSSTWGTAQPRLHPHPAQTACGQHQGGRHEPTCCASGQGLPRLSQDHGHSCSASQNLSAPKVTLFSIPLKSSTKEDGHFVLHPRTA